jgi:ketosteroid isomerase-like protein
MKRLINRRLSFLSLALLLAACTSSRDGVTTTVTTQEAKLRYNEATVLMDADRAFAEASYTRGADAWGDVWAEDGMKPDSPTAPAFGKEAVRKQMQQLYADAETKLQWHPIRAEISPGGNLGYTWGRYLLTGKNPKGEPISREGTYVTVWEKQKDGTWKILFDTGDGDKPRT